MTKTRFKIPLHSLKASGLLLLLWLLIPANGAQAAVLYFAPDNLEIGVNQLFKVSLMINPENQSINALEGKITFNQDYFELIEILEGESMVNYWVVKPQLNCAESCQINFSGIIPGGFSGLVSWDNTEERPGNVLSFVLKAKKNSEQRISLADIKVLLNDGRGTAASIKSGLAIIKISDLPNTAYQFPADDLPPEDFKPIIGRNPNIFNGQYFLAFATQDKGTGLDHYEISENNQPFVKAASPYLLKYQGLNKEIIIKAIDKSGNERLVILPPQKPTKWLNNYWIETIIMMTLIIAIFCYYRLRRRSKCTDKTKNNQL